MLIKKPLAFNKKKTLKNHDRHYHGSLERSYTPVSQLLIGMYIVELDRPWLETPFLFQGFELTTEQQIQTVRNLCNYVFIDKTRTKKIRLALASSKNSNNKLRDLFIDDNIKPPEKLGEFEQEIIRAENIFSYTEALITDFMKIAARGSSIDGWLAQKAVAECVNSVLYSPDAMLWLIRLKSKDEFAVQHSLNTCVLSIILGRHLNFPAEKIVNLGICGMLHDIGKMLIPFDILKKEAHLNEEEQTIMQSHTVLGYELLRSSDNIGLSAVETALTHHEHLDGTGYPRQLKQANISTLAKIVAITSTYDSLTHERNYLNSKTHLEATLMLANMAGHQLDRYLVFKFIESLGVYPPGCLVMLTNGAIGIVVEVNEQIKLRPKIIILLDEERNPVAEEIIDLSQMIHDKNGNLYTIKNVIKAEDWNIDTRKYYQEGILQKSFAASH